MDRRHCLSITLPDGCKVAATPISLFVQGVLQTAVIQSRAVLKNVPLLQHVAREAWGHEGSEQHFGFLTDLDLFERCCLYLSPGTDQ